MMARIASRCNIDFNEQFPFQKRTVDCEERLIFSFTFPPSRAILNGENVFRPELQSTF